MATRGMTLSSNIASIQPIQPVLALDVGAGVFQRAEACIQAEHLALPFLHRIIP